MSILKSLLLASVLLIMVACGGPENKNENKNPSPSPIAVNPPKEDKPCEPLGHPCTDRFLVRHSYPKCCSGMWHVVEDDYQNCPPVMPFRVEDLRTEQTCETGAAPPEGLGPFSDIKDLCPNPTDTGDKVTLTECFHGHWRTAIYSVYKCPDSPRKGIHKDHPDSAKEYQEACTEPMPAYTPPSP